LEATKGAPLAEQRGLGDWGAPGALQCHGTFRVENRRVITYAYNLQFLGASDARRDRSN
jgi:hypothetical protein